MLIFALSIEAHSQQLPVKALAAFVPMSLHEARSVELLRAIDSHFAAERQMRSAVRDPWVDNIRQRQASLLKRMVRAKAFIDDDSLQRYVDSYFERLAQANGLSGSGRLVLIMNTPERNAACYGAGVFIVTTGLLAHLKDEASLAFILAHEMAHDELQHVQQSLHVLSRERESRNPRAAMTRILLSDVSEEYIDSFRAALYASAAMSRDHEIEADSMAVYAIQRAGYPLSAAACALRELASVRHSSAEDLFTAFQFADFPFKEHWLDERLKVFHRKPGDTYLLSYDSLRSHPDTEKRIAALTIHTARIPSRNSGPAYNTHVTRRMAERSAFQSVEAAYLSNQYDIALYNILSLLKTHPGDPYLVEMTGRMLIDIYHQKSQGTIETVSQYTSNLGPGERSVNNFLFNISKEETAELAYLFLNNKSHFNKSSAVHHYLLWEACSLTSRSQVGARVQASYRDRFAADITSFRFVH